MEKNLKKIKWARLSILSNTCLIIMKVIVGIITGSLAIIAESIHSFIDLLASFITFFAVKESSQPADKDHQFGHAKFEDLSGLIEAFLIIGTAFFIIHESIPKVIKPEELKFIDSAITVMFVSAVVNFFVSRKLYKISHETDSIALEADGAHLLIDVYTSLGVMLSMVIIRITNLFILDPIISISIAIYIIIIGIKISLKSIKNLVDEGITNENIEDIKKIINNHTKSISSFHKLATRKAGNITMIDVHLQFNGEESVKKAHEISHLIQTDLTKKFLNTRIMIHIEPCKDNCSECYVENCSERKII